MPLHFNTLLIEAGIDPVEVRLLRHQPQVGGRYLQDVFRADPAVFEAYQALQLTEQRARFERPIWAAFAGTWNGRTVFLGLYAAGEPVALPEEVTSPISGETFTPGTRDRYPLERMDALRDCAGRLYIDWGGGTSGARAWVQRADAQDKQITELHASAAERPFPGLMGLTESLSALSSVPHGWVEQLAAAKGVYVLTCPRDGSLYVGSATAEGGFWSRWTSYRANGHGGNVALIGREPSDFTVSVLQVAGSGDSQEAIYAMEDRWKRKLGARTFGLCRN